jgi:release factor glutamine methyltransferase
MNGARDDAGGGPDAAGTVTWRELWSQTTDVLGDRQHARWMCEVAAAANGGDEFIARLDEPATVRMVAHLDAMVMRRQHGEPLQYVLGEWSFRRLTLAVDRRVLIPRPETELVAGVAIELAAACGPTRTVIDLGTGSGAIGLSMAVELPRRTTTVWITDASSDALDVARANLAGIGPAATGVRIAHGSWFDAVPGDLRFDVVVANPPYVALGSPDLDADVASWEPPSALFSGPDGLDDIREIIAAAPDRLVLEIGSGQGVSVAQLLNDAGYVDVDVRPDLAAHDRVAVARRAD